MGQPSPLMNRFPVQIYNSLHRKKEPFEPINPPHVGMYVCGPTVYSEIHIGNARPYIFFDVVLRYLRYLGYRVRYVRNLTDVGHLEDEMTDSGEDKISKKARLEQLEPMEIAQRYINSYRDLMAQLNTLPPSIEPRATGHMLEQIGLIKLMLKNGYAYEVDGSIYFDIDAYEKQHSYGILSGRKIEDMLSGTRDLVGQGEKRKSYDFALWKKAAPEHIMRWESPWSDGFPGWHLECTAMGTKYLGAPFDIHGGGMDLQFPHHEAEIAQGVAALGTTPVKYWMHNNLLTINGQKMSKSAGNFITVPQMFSGDHDILDKAYSPMTVRFFTLQAHYRSPMDFSNEALAAAEKGYRRLMNALAALHSLTYSGKPAVDAGEDAQINSLLNEAFENLSDDFNTARAMANVFDLATRINSYKDQQIPLNRISPETFKRLQDDFHTLVTEILGLIPEGDSSSEKLDSVMQLLINMRNEARQNKDYALSDRIRDQLQEIGVQLKDGRDGTGYTMD